MTSIDIMDLWTNNNVLVLSKFIIRRFFFQDSILFSFTAKLKLFRNLLGKGFLGTRQDVSRFMQNGTKLPRDCRCSVREREGEHPSKRARARDPSSSGVIRTTV